MHIADLREREVAVKEREASLRQEELALKKEDQSSSWWRNPLTVAVLAGALAAAGNAGISVYNGRSQRQLEAEKAEQSRVLEMLKTNGDADQAARNLKFLLDANLISQPDFRSRLSTFLNGRRPGTGPTLASQDQNQQLGSPVVSNARVYVLTGRSNGVSDMNDLSADLKTSGYSVLGSKYLFDEGRPTVPEIRYFNGSDKRQADVLQEFLKFRLGRKDVSEKQYFVSTAKPGYIEVWLGK